MKDPDSGGVALNAATKGGGTEAKTAKNEKEPKKDEKTGEK